jgi:hypothetical protein
MNFLCIGLALCWVACSVEESKEPQEKSEKQHRPEAVDLMQDKAKKIARNNEGYWEAGAAGRIGPDI